MSGSDTEQVRPAGGLGGPGPAPGLRAVLFDMDGTLVDTEGLWWQATVETAAGMGRTLTSEDATAALGSSVASTARYLHALTGTARSPEDLGEELDARFTVLVSRGVTLMPGALALLDSLAREGVPLALVSASPRGVVDLVLATLGRERFAVTVSADDTVRTKPDPAPYLAATRHLGAGPASCVAVEDSPTGVASAEAAGCRVLAVPSGTAIAPGPGRIVRAGLEQADTALLRSLVG